MSVNFHFLNVGSGDCTIVHFPPRETNAGRTVKERIMMVDICQHDGYENVIDYYKRNFRNPDGSIKPIFRFVCTHPHQDHICGLKEFFDDNSIIIYNFWDLEHSFKPEDFDHYPKHEEDWEAYNTLRGPDSPATVIRASRKDTPRLYWNDGEDRISILSPCDNLTHQAHYNEDGDKRASHEIEIDEISYALSIRINERIVVLASDGRSSPCWNNIYDHCKIFIKNCSVLKAGHHGHESSFHEEAAKLMNPALIIFSNSEEQDKENGAEVSYIEAVPDALILKTHESGTIMVSIPFDSNEEIQFSKSK